MIAAYLKGHGGSEMLELGALPDPVPAAGEVLVRTHAIALNHLDVWVRKGWRGLALNFPHVVGADAAGVVEAVAADVTGLHPGDEVVLSAGWFCGECPRCLAGEENLCPRFHLFGEHRPGCAAERFCAPARNLLPKPPSLSFESAAAVGVSSLTAHHMLIARAKLQAGETLLVQGASSGVGNAAIALAVSLGARVIALTSSDAKAQRALELGAETALDRNTLSASELKQALKTLAPQGVDVVFEHTGELSWPLSIKALRTGGRLVTCGATTGPNGAIDLRVLFTRQLSLLGSTMGTRQELADCLQRAAEGSLLPQIDRVLPLAHIHEAYALLENAQHFGKIVLRP